MSKITEAIATLEWMLAGEQTALIIKLVEDEFIEAGLVASDVFDKMEKEDREKLENKWHDKIVKVLCDGRNVARKTK